MEATIIKIEAIKKILGIVEEDNEFRDLLNKWMQYREALGELGDNNFKKYGELIHERIFGQVDVNSSKYQLAKDESIRIWEKVYGTAKNV